MNDHFKDGGRGTPFRGSTVEDSLDYSRGKSAQDEGREGGMVVATVLLSPVICAAYPIAGVGTLATAMLVSKGAPLFGVREASGVLILLTLLSMVAAFFAGLALERRASKSKAYRTVRWLLRFLVVPGVIVSMLVGGRAAPGPGRLLVLLLFVPVCYWFVKGLDRFIGTTGRG